MTISPLNESGNPVDRWFIYKVPRAAQENITGIGPASGYEYAYFDDAIGAVQASPFKLDGGKGALNLTLSSVFDEKTDATGWILYNDEHPIEELDYQDNGALGHTKGALLFDVDSDTGLWLLHSWPKYVWPDAPEMPTPMYGQTFLCLALTLKSIEQLAAQMIEFQQPEVFTSQLPAGLPADSPIRQLGKAVDIGAAGGANAIDLMTRAEFPFKVIAKNRNWNKDFWNQLVAPTLGADINVETWIRGGAKVIPGTWDEAKVYTTSDIKFITLQAIGLPWAWSEVDDHAKWAISDSDNWLCVGDINRMISQRKRGGCTIAFRDAVLWNLMSKTDLINAPAGMSHCDAVSHIQRTHEVLDRTGKRVVHAPGTWHGEKLKPLGPIPTQAEALQAQRPTAPLTNHMHIATKDLRAAGASSYGSILGTVDKSREKPISGRSGEHLQFFLNLYGSTQYQVDTNTQSEDGTEIGAYVADEVLAAVSTDPPFGPEQIGVFPNASLSYKHMGLVDSNFAPLSSLRLDAQLEAALNQSAYVEVYGFTFDDGGQRGKGIHETHLNPGKDNQDGAVAVYMINSQGQPIRRWFFFKFQGDSI
jgi:deoxyribonuclease-2